MAKQPVSVTLDVDNLLWLRSRAATRKRRSLSDALDEIVTAARTGGSPTTSRSVVGTVSIPIDDPNLDRADEYVRTLMTRSIDRLFVHEDRARYAATPAPRRRDTAKARARGRG